MRGLRVKGPGVRRALSHLGLVASLWAVLTACATAAGASALLVTAGNERALAAAVAAADGHADSGSPDITTVVVTSASGEGKPQVTADVAISVAREALLDAAGSDSAGISVWASSPMLYLPGEEVRRGYFLDADTVQAQGTLTDGTWPAASSSATGPIEVAVPSTTAAALGIEVGSTLRLTGERQHGDEVPAGDDVVVVGIFNPSSSGEWSRDTLRGAGYAASYDWLPAYGPFVVSPGTLEERAAPFARISLVLDPNLAGQAASIDPLVRRIAGVPHRIEGELGSAVGPVVMKSQLGAAYATMRSELSLTNSLVMSVFLMVLALGLATTALVARVLARRRANELTLLRDRGASVLQLTRSATAETAILAALAMAAAVPLALWVYASIAESPRWAPSWAEVAAQGPGVRPALLAAVAVGAVVPAVIVVLTLVPARARRARHIVSGPIARSGLDVMIVLVAAVMWLQLRSHEVSAHAIDPMLVVAPAACVIALAALASRVIPLIARAANWAARKGRGVVVPLAGWNVARGGATHGTFLVVLAVSVGSLGVTFLGTWSASQADQAEAIVGADVVVAQPGAPGFAATLAATTAGEVTPVATEPVVLGSRPDGVTVVAIDSTLADQVVRGRLAGSLQWSQQMAGLAPESAGAPMSFEGDGFTVTVTGGAAPGKGTTDRSAVPVVTAIATFVVADQWGFVTTVEGTPVPLDGEPHSMTLPGAAHHVLADGEWHILAIDVVLGEHGGEDLIGWGNAMMPADLTLQVSGATSDAAAWDMTTAGGEESLSPGKADVASGTLTASFTYSVLGLSWQDAHLVLVGFPVSTDVPVVMTSELAHQLDLATGDRIAMTWGITRLDAVLVGTAPYVPSHVREDAILADLNSLQRALLSAGNIGPVGNEWWISTADAGAADAVRAHGWGPVSSAAETAHALRDGPLRVSLKFAWAVAIVAAVGLAIAGSAAHAAGAALERSASIAKLRAVGVPRRAALASHVLQQATVVFGSTAVGVAVGTALSWLIAPLLVVSPGGQPAVPAVELVWSVAAVLAVACTIAVGALLVGTPSARSMVKRSTVAALRAGDAS